MVRYPWQMFLHSHHDEARSNRDEILYRFQTELSEIQALHRYQVETIESDYDKWTEEYGDQLSDPENYDGGDAHYYAVKKLGSEPSDAISHIGCMTIVRAVALAEITLAHLAATTWEHPEKTVFPEGGTWSHGWAIAFYDGVTKTKLDLTTNGFDAIRDLRNTYAHGYGIAGTPEKLRALAKSLSENFDHGPATDAELKLGFGNDARFFASSTGTDEAGTPLRFFGSVPPADMTPLMTHRVLERVGEVISRAKISADSGLIDEIGGSEFGKKVMNFWRGVDKKKAKAAKNSVPVA